MNQATAVRWRTAVAASAAAIVIGVGVCEALGWPFLAAPLQRELGRVLDRRVSFAADPGSDPTLTIHLFGAIGIDAAQLEIGAPAWSTAPYLVRARDARLTLGYLDLWRATHGEPLHIRELRATQLDGQLDRRRHLFVPVS